MWYFTKSRTKKCDILQKVELKSVLSENSRDVPADRREAEYDERRYRVDGKESCL